MIRVKDESTTMLNLVNYYNDPDKYEKEIRELGIIEFVQESLQRLYSREANERLVEHDIDNQISQFDITKFGKSEDPKNYSKTNHKCVPYFFKNYVLLNKPAEFELPYYRRCKADCIARVAGWIDKDPSYKYNRVLYNETETPLKGWIVEEFAGMPIHNAYQSMDDGDVLCAIMQLIDAVVYMNSVGIRHQDLSNLNNIQYNIDKKRICIIDFDNSDLDPLNVERCSKNDFKQLIDCVNELWLGEKKYEKGELEFNGVKHKSYYVFYCGESEFEIELSDLLTNYYSAINNVFVTPVMFGSDYRKIVKEFYPDVSLPSPPTMNEEQLEYNMKCMYDLGYLID